MGPMMGEPNDQLVSLPAEEVPRLRAQMDDGMETGPDSPPLRCLLGFHKRPDVRHNVGVRCARPGCDHEFPAPTSGVAIMPEADLPPGFDLADFVGGPASPLRPAFVPGSGEHEARSSVLGQRVVGVTLEADAQTGDRIELRCEGGGRFVVVADPERPGVLGHRWEAE